MNKIDYLLVCLGEECNEIAVRVAKIQRFGLDETQEGKREDNKERLRGEIIDLISVLYLLGPEIGVEVGPILKTSEMMQRAVERKLHKMGEYMEYSRKLGILKP